MYVHKCTPSDCYPSEQLELLDMPDSTIRVMIATNLWVSMVLGTIEVVTITDVVQKIA